MFCNVIVTRPFDQVYTYKLKKDQYVKEGTIVSAPFGKKKDQIGMVVKLIDTPKPTKDFVIPADSSKDMIMIGPGTGIAPFRAFLEQRIKDKATGRNWLFFGEVHEESTFFYRDEWFKAMREGHLEKLTTAFSRDQENKIYVQHRLLSNSKEIWKWLQAGSYFYVCGDKKYMAKDVHAALIEIAQKEGNLKKKDAENYINQTLMKDEHRYLRDVY